MTEVTDEHAASLDQLGLGLGKKARLHRILHEHGVGNGTAIFLPYDHGLEHGPRDFAGHPESGDPRHVIRLAMLEKARESMDAGATGLIFGRNVFQRGHDESLRFVAQLKEILAKYPS